MKNIIKEKRNIVKTSDSKTICLLCAWRSDCKKKYSQTGHNYLKCPDFSKDVGSKH